MNIKPVIELDHRLWRSARQLRLWQMITTFLAVALGISSATVFLQARRGSAVPYLVTVDRSGKPVPEALAARIRPDDDRIVLAEITQLLINLRTVPGDLDLRRQQVVAAYTRLTSDARNTVDAWYARPENNHALTVASRRTLIRIESILPIPGVSGAWVATWVEHTRPIQGTQEEIAHWTSTLQVEFRPPTEPDEILLNPTGFYVAGLSWQPTTPRNP